MEKSFIKENCYENIPTELFDQLYENQKSIMDSGKLAPSYLIVLDD